MYVHAGRILSIYQRGTSKLTSDPTLYLKLAMFYRPEDTHKGAAAGREADLCLLYWGDEGMVLESDSPNLDLLGKIWMVFQFFTLVHSLLSLPFRGGGGGE